MNEKAIGLIVFFTSLAIFSHVRFLLKLRKIRKNVGNVPGNFYWLGAIDACFAIAECGACCASAAEAESQAKRHREPPTEQKALSREFQGWQPDAEPKEIVHLTYEEEREKVISIAKGSPRTSLGWVVNTTLIPVERVIGIISYEPDFFIDNDQIFYLPLLTKEELEEVERKKRTRKMREETKTKTAKRLIITEAEREKIIETVSIKRKTSLTWTSNVVNLPIEKVAQVIDNHPNFVIKNGFIFEKKELQDNMKICSNCENPFEQGSEFCPNCGHKLKN